MTFKEENQTNERFSNKRGILNRDDLEYSAGKLFQYSAIGLTALGIYIYVAYLFVQQAKK